MENQEITKDTTAVKGYRNIAVKWGLIGAAVIISFTVIMYIINWELMVNMWMGFLGLAILIVLLRTGVKEIKNNQGGYISLSEALFASFLIYLIASFLNMLFSYALMTWIDPNLPVLMKEKTIQTTVEMMQKFGGSEEDINKALDSLDSIDTASFSSQFWNFAKGSAFGFIISFIVALIMRKKRPVFE